MDHVNKKVFNIQLSLEDELHCEITTKNGKMIFFVIEYNAIVNDKKRSIFRIDTKHDCVHKHIFYKKNKKDSRRIVLSYNIDDYSDYYNEYLKYLEKNFNKIRDNYLRN